MRVEAGRWVSAKRRTWSIAWSSARRIAWLEAVARVAQVGRVEDEAAVGAATTHGRVRVADRGVATFADVGEGRAGGLADARVGDRAAPGQGSMLATGIGIARRDRGQIEALQAERAAASVVGPPDGAVSGVTASASAVGRVALTGRSSRSAGPGSPTRRPP